MFRRPCRKCRPQGLNCTTKQTQLVAEPIEHLDGFNVKEDSEFVYFTDDKRTAIFPGHPSYMASPLKHRQLLRSAIGEKPFGPGITFYEISFEGHNSDHTAAFCVGIADRLPRRQLEDIDQWVRCAIWSNGIIDEGARVNANYKDFRKAKNLPGTPVVYGVCLNRPKDQLIFTINNRRIWRMSKCFRECPKELFLLVHATGVKATITYSASDTPYNTSKIPSSLLQCGLTSVVKMLRKKAEKEQEELLNGIPWSLRNQVEWRMKINSPSIGTDVCPTKASLLQSQSAKQMEREMLKNNNSFVACFSPLWY